VRQGNRPYGRQLVSVGRSPRQLHCMSMGGEKHCHFPQAWIKPVRTHCSCGAITRVRTHCFCVVVCHLHGRVITRDVCCGGMAAGWLGPNAVSPQRSAAVGRTRNRVKNQGSHAHRSSPSCVPEGQPVIAQRLIAGERSAAPPGVPSGTADVRLSRPSGTLCQDHSQPQSQRSIAGLLSVVPP
jgi:hypothetical protein